METPQYLTIVTIKIVIQQKMDLFKIIISELPIIRKQVGQQKDLLTILYLHQQNIDCKWQATREE